MKRIVALIYHSYLSRKLDIVYVRTIMTLIGGIIVLMAVFWMIFKITMVSPFYVSSKGATNLISGGIFVCILMALLALLFRKKELEQFSFTERQLKAATRNIFLYFVGLILLLVGTLILHANHFF